MGCGCPGSGPPVRKRRRLWPLLLLSQARGKHRGNPIGPHDAFLRHPSFGIGNKLRPGIAAKEFSPRPARYMRIESDANRLEVAFGFLEEGKGPRPVASWLEGTGEGQGTECPDPKDTASLQPRGIPLCPCKECVVPLGLRGRNEGPRAKRASLAVDNVGSEIVRRAVSVSSRKSQAVLRMLRESDVAR